ncbi:helix-turn-helix transcriptional regulator [Leuconostoc holzapfelii]|uniref:Helix-turn-helix transcriptional regulator n=1 Tax=Leuconostoc holzapfelii TaxID=434464 RepID=A0A846ZDU3_9LACO|nr:AraC family transcriptional regulator [Leuconostoc holzapfelii]NKZ17649.1 helix-turn-helix transcriptional regulator [Leuconostoc holzapfelii]
MAWFYFKTIQSYRINNFLPLATRIKSYINEHICDNILLADIAEAVHTSKKNLNPAFKAEFGVTITQFIRSAKIDRAKEILVISDAAIPEIASHLAFSTPSYFIKTFKNITGMTPNYFRNNFLSLTASQ